MPGRFVWLEVEVGDVFESPSQSGSTNYTLLDSS